MGCRDGTVSQKQPRIQPRIQPNAGECSHRGMLWVLSVLTLRAPSVIARLELHLPALSTNARCGFVSCTCAVGPPACCGSGAFTTMPMYDWRPSGRTPGANHSKYNHVYPLRKLCVVIAARKCYIRLTRLVLNAANVRCFCLCLGACD